jgi:hypothetical protein
MPSEPVTENVEYRVEENGTEKFDGELIYANVLEP